MSKKITQREKGAVAGKVRNGKIDLLKFLFSLVVAMYHFSNAVKYENERFRYGYFSVEFFFIVSGFLFAKSLSKYDGKEVTNLFGESLSFMKRKYLSFMPYHIGICLMYIGVWFIADKQTVVDVAKNLILGIPDLLLIQILTDTPVNLFGHEWYLSAMLAVMFVLTPILIKFRKQYSMYFAPIISLVIMGCMFNIYENMDLAILLNGAENKSMVTMIAGVINPGVFRAFADISIGCICYAVYESGAAEKINRILLLAAEILIYITVFVFMDNHTDAAAAYGVVYLLAFGVIISFSDKASLNFLNNKFVYFLGRLSLPIYMCHLLVRKFIAPMNIESGYGAHLILFLAASIGTALVYMLVIDFVMSLKKKRKKKSV